MKTVAHIFDRYRQILSENDFVLFLNACESPLKKSIRVNGIKNSLAIFQDHVKKYTDWKLTPIPWCSGGFWIERDKQSPPLGNTVEHQAGLFYIQEAASMLPAILLSPEKNDFVLDIAAAPGSKTTHIADIMENTGKILANEPSNKRLKKLESNILRLGVMNALITSKNGTAFQQLFPNTFDKVLLDAPCSGEGYLRKSKKILRQWSLRNIHAMSKLQKKLLESAFLSLKPGGELVYSTCTLAPEENEEVIDYLINTYSNAVEIIDLPQVFKTLSNTLSNVSEKISTEKFSGIGKFMNKTYHSDVKKALRLWPHLFDTEGFFMCKIKKLQKTTISAKPIPPSRTPEGMKQMNKKDILAFCNYMKKTYKWEPFPYKQARWMKKGKKIFITPRGETSVRQRIPVLTSGFFVAYHDTSEYKLSHEAISLWGKHFKKQKHICSEQQKNDFTKGKNIALEPPTNLQNGTIVLCYNDIVLGKGLLKDTIIKNQLPREYIN